MKSLLLGCLSIACAASALMSAALSAALPASAATSEIPYEPNLKGQTVQCSDFKPGPDGTWITVRSIMVQRQNQYTTIAADASFKAGGQPTVGLDVGAMLDKSCPR